MRKHARKLNRTFCVVASLLLALLTFVYFMPNGIYARYKSSITATDSAKVAPFAPQLIIHDRDTISYSNVSAEIGAPKDASFSVQNFTEYYDGETKTGEVVSAVDLTYSLIFYIPEDTFAKTAMIQFMADNDTPTPTPIMPMYNLQKCLEAAEGGKTYDTANDEATADYNSELTVPNETLTSEDGWTATADDTQSVTFSVVQQNEEQESAGTITIEKGVTMQTDYYLLFSFWENGASTPIKPTLKVDQRGEIGYLKITVSRPEFYLPCGGENGGKVEHKWFLRLLPLTGMTETETPVDSTLHTHWDTMVTSIKQEQLSIIDKPKGEEGMWSVTLSDDYTVTVTRKASDSDITVWTTKKLEEVETPDSNTNYGMTIGYESGANGDSCGKGYPCRLNAIFEQVAPSS